VILCTHILPEVTQLCDKVVIIARGQVVAEETLDALTATDDLEAVFLKVTAHDVEAVTELSEATEDEAPSDDAPSDADGETGDDTPTPTGDTAP
jgi:ABC-type multidrug transport system ATPase subunit